MMPGGFDRPLCLGERERDNKLPVQIRGKHPELFTLLESDGGAKWRRGVRHPSCPGEEEEERERERTAVRGEGHTSPWLSELRPCIGEEQQDA